MTALRTALKVSLDACQPPLAERGKEDRLERAERVTIEQVEVAVWEAVRQAEDGRESIETAQQLIAQQQSLSELLTPEEQARIRVARTSAEDKLRELTAKALEARIAQIRTAAAMVGSEHYRGAQAAVLTQLAEELVALSRTSIPSNAPSSASPSPPSPGERSGGEARTALPGQGGEVMATRLEDVLRTSRALSSDDRRALLDALRRDLDAGDGGADITELEGLGAEVWTGVDPDAYIRQERATWDRSTG